MSGDVSLSTMWSLNYENMAEFVQDAREFGFTHLELSSVLSHETLEALRGIGEMPVSSVHAPCPNIETPEGLASTLSLSSFDEDERQAAVKAAKSTVDLAADVEAEVVILHAGYAEMNPEMEKVLRRLWNQGATESPQFAELKCKLMEVRQFLACPHVDAVKESLLELAVYARPKGVRLALENRVNYHEIPNLDEMMDILCEFQPEVMGYWHDVGHAQIQSLTGFTPHEDWFVALVDRLVGVHLHDVRGLQDHCAPGIGDLDWDLITANLPADTIRVCEIGEWNDPGDARKSVAFLTDKGII